MTSPKDIVREICEFLNHLLTPERYSDSAINGMQVDGTVLGLEKLRIDSHSVTVAFAVDAGLSCIESAIKARADLMIVHHGLFWGESQPIIGPHANKLYNLLSHNCTLYASHLPLDGHPDVGNGAELLRAIGAEDIKPFLVYKGSYVGAQGRLAKAMPIESIIERTKAFEGCTNVTTLPFGAHTISTIGCVTGSGTFGIPEAKKLGLDLFLSGEPKHEAYHLTKELGISAVFAGHYATETFGLRALQRIIEKKFFVRTIFLEEPTGI
jgi:dinuclear metal center YbgI/SA1388 family protein